MITKINNFLQLKFSDEQKFMEIYYKNEHIKRHAMYYVFD
jgi:hypothetical protein